MDHPTRSRAAFILPAILFVTCAWIAWRAFATAHEATDDATSMPVAEAPAPRRADLARTAELGAAPATRRAESRSALPSPDDLLPLTGRVVDGTGQPLASARVDLLHRHAQGFTWLGDDAFAPAPRVASATTGGDGRFAFEVRRGVAFSLAATAEGLAIAPRHDCHGGDDVVLRALPGATFAGCVLRAADQSPIAGARLRMQRHGDGEIVPLATTDATGRFACTGLAAGRATVDVLPQQGTPPKDLPVTFEPGATLHHEFLIEAGATVRGRVTDAVTGAPIADAEVGEWWSFRRSVRTDAEGRYVFAGFPTPDVDELGARARGFSAGTKRVVTRADDQVADFVLARSGSIRGRVVDPRRAGIAGARVAAVRSVEIDGRLTVLWVATSTSDDGAFLLPDVPTGPGAALLATAAGLASRCWETPAISAGNTLDVGNLVMGPPSVIEGRVVTADGRGLAGAAVYLIGGNRDRLALVPGSMPPDDRRARSSAGGSAGGSSVLRRRTTTDDQGAFRFAEVAEGAYTIDADWKRVRAPSRRVEVAASLDFHAPKIC